MALSPSSGAAGRPDCRDYFKKAAAGGGLPEQPDGGDIRQTLADSADFVLRHLWQLLPVPADAGH